MFYNYSSKRPNVHNNEDLKCDITYIIIDSKFAHADPFMKFSKCSDIAVILTTYYFLATAVPEVET